MMTLYLSLATAAISLTVTRSVLFAPLRAKLKGKLHELFSCPYCFSHWVSFALVLQYQHKLFDCGFPPTDYFITAMVLVALSNLVTFTLLKLMHTDEVNIEPLQIQLEAQQEAIEYLLHKE